jgi:short-subunit dehydrogenase
MLNPACRLVIKVVDFSDTDAVQTLCHDLGKNKNLAVLINNAGIFMPGTTDIEYQNLLDMTEVNFFAPFLLTQAVSHAMQKNKQGYIINIASNAARRVISGIGAYSASKHALLGLSGSLMLELLPHNIKVTNINPGFTNTDMTRHFPNLADDEKIQPQDIVNCISFLLSLSPGAIIPNIDVECARFP